MSNFIKDLLFTIKRKGVFKNIDIDISNTYASNAYTLIEVIVYKNNVKKQVIYKNEYSFDNSVKELTEDQRMDFLSARIKEDFIICALSKFIEVYELKQLKE